MICSLSYSATQEIYKMVKATIYTGYFFIKKTIPRELAPLLFLPYGRRSMGYAAEMVKRAKPSGYGTNPSL